MMTLTRHYWSSPLFNCGDAAITCSDEAENQFICVTSYNGESFVTPHVVEFCNRRRYRVAINMSTATRLCYIGSLVATGIRRCPQLPPIPLGNLDPS
jgi:hypothetical protein